MLRNSHMLAHRFPDSKVHGANMGPTWGRQDPGGPHVGPMNFALWVQTVLLLCRDEKQNDNKPPIVKVSPDFVTLQKSVKLPG